MSIIINFNSKLCRQTIYRPKWRECENWYSCWKIMVIRDGDFPWIWNDSLGINNQVLNKVRGMSMTSTSIIRYQQRKKFSCDLCVNYFFDYYYKIWRTPTMKVTRHIRIPTRMLNYRLRITLRNSKKIIKFFSLVLNWMKLIFKYRNFPLRFKRIRESINIR